MGEARFIGRTLVRIVACLVLLSSTPGKAHPGHASEAELDWNPGQTMLEVSLAVLPEQLEEAIGLSLAADGAQAATERYLQGHFRLLGDADVPGRVTLIGVEEEYQRTWLYFTVERPAGEVLRLEFSVLQERYAGQVNRARLRWTGGANTLVFTPGSAPQALPPASGEPAAESTF